MSRVQQIRQAIVILDIRVFDLIQDSELTLFIRMSYHGHVDLNTGIVDINQYDPELTWVISGFVSTQPS